MHGRVLNGNNLNSRSNGNKKGWNSSALKGQRAPKAQGVTLTERDRQLLRFVGENGLASFDQLSRKFWHNALPRTCRERLYRLERCGWLEARRVDQRRPAELVFVLTHLGANRFSALERKQLMVGLPASHEICQQLLAQEARLFLEAKLRTEGGRLLSWQNEHVLRSEAHQRNKPNGSNFGGAWAGIADAVALVSDRQGRSGKVLIECDGAYFGRMLQAKLQALAECGYPALWVTERAGRIRQELANLNASNITVVPVVE